MCFGNGKLLLPGGIATLTPACRDYKLRVRIGRSTVTARGIFTHVDLILHNAQGIVMLKPSAEGIYGLLGTGRKGGGEG